MVLLHLCRCARLCRAVDEALKLTLALRVGPPYTGASTAPGRLGIGGLSLIHQVQGYPETIAGVFW